MPEIKADVTLDIANWQRNIRTVVDDAAAVESILRDLEQTAQSIDLSIVTDTANIAVGVDTSAIDRAVQQRNQLEQDTAFTADANDTDITSAVDTQAELNENTDFTANANDAPIQNAARVQQTLNENTSFDANVNTSGIATALREAQNLEDTRSFDVNVNDSEVDTAVRNAADLDQTRQMDVNVDDSEVQDTLRQIRDLAIVDVTLNLAGTAIETLNSLFDLTGAPGIIETNEALRQLEGTTGRMIPGARELIEDLYTNAWGESRSEIADTIALATQLGVTQEDLAGAVETAFQVASVTGEETNKVLRAMDSLVQNNLVDSYQEAGDVIVSGFQQGGDVAEDLNDTLIEYGSTFAALGLDAEQATGVLISGMNAGFMNTDLAADSLRELNIRLREAGNEEVQAALEALKLEDQLDAFRQGEIDGAQFVSSIVTGLSEMENQQEANTIAVSLFGTQVEDVGLQAIEALDPIAASLEDTAGAAEDASNTVNDTLATSFTELKRTIETELGNLLTETLDIEAVIDDLQRRIGEFVDSIESGEGFLESVEVAFDLPGLTDTLETIQQVFAEIGIGILQAMSAVLEFVGKDGSAAAIDEFATQLAATQFQVEMNASDSIADMQDATQRALERGVDESDIASSMRSLFSNALSQQDLVDAQQIMVAYGSALSTADFSTIQQQLGIILSTVDSNELANGTDAAFNQIMAQVQVNLPALRETFGEGMSAEEIAQQIFDHGQVIPQLDAAFAEVRNEAIANDDLQALVELRDVGFVDAQLSGAIAQIKGNYEEVFSEAIAQGDYQSAFEAIEVLGPEASEAAQQQMQGFTNQLHGAFEQAMSEQDFDAARQIANQLNDPVLMESVQEMQSTLDSVNTDALETSMDNAGQSVSGLGDDMGTTASDVSSQTAAIDTEFSGVQGSAAAMNAGTALSLVALALASRVNASAIADNAATMDSAFTQSSDTMQTTSGDMSDTSDQLSDNIDDTFSDIADTVRDESDSAADSAGDAFDDMGRDVSRSMDSIASDVESGMRDSERAVSSGTTDIKRQFTTAMESAGQSVQSGMNQIEGNFTSGMTASRASVQSGMKQIEGNFVSGMTASKASVQSGMSAMQSSVQSGMAGVVVQVQSGNQQMEAAFQQTGQITTNAMTTAVQAVINLGNQTSQVASNVSSAANSIGAAFQPIPGAVAGPVDQAAAKMRELITAAQDTGANVTNQSARMRDGFLDYSNVTQREIDEIIGKLQDMINKAIEAADTIEAIPDDPGGGGGGGGGDDPPGDNPGGAMATGGVMSAGQGFFVGEAGREFITPNTDMAVLNKQTTDALVNAVNALGFAGGDVTNNYTFNYQISASSDAALMQQTNANQQLRGF